jgi:hypothetical protein
VIVSDLHYRRSGHREQVENESTGRPLSPRNIREYLTVIREETYGMIREQQLRQFYRT